MHKRSKILIAGFLTLGLVGSVVAYSKHGHHGFHVKKRITKTLELDTQQSTRLDELVQTLRSSGKQLRAEHLTDATQVLALLEESRLDQDKAMEMIRAKLDAVEQHAQIVIASAAGFTDSLSVEQRSRLKEIADKKLSKRHWHDDDH